ncbi:hypothetical protein KUTeg_002089 [Tegillarca granosa]|uniref:Uncharacterized protein n=1 Tax=Tegillarca granosa TaxID=220873 RepID=A0ABQ9FWY4_TEGGR|nr:hypothetical protein KUTeg_002089 [Tegillarca granosa]
MDDDKGYIVDLTVTICFSMDGERYCVPVDEGLLLMQKEQIPICDAKNFTNFKNFSLSDWYKDKQLDLTQQLSKGAVDLLLQQLGMADFFSKTPCKIKRSPYTPNVRGFHNNCTLTLFKLPDISKYPIACFIPDYCTGIDCCGTLDKLGLSLRTYVYLDTCDYRLFGGIETITFNITLFDYEWGKKEVISVGDGIVRFE